MPSRRKPLKHQIEALTKLRKRGGRCGLYMAPGTGKTLVAIRYARIYSPVLAIMRSDDMLTWETELQLEGEPPPFCIESAKDVRDTPSRAKWTCVTYDLLKNPDVYRYVTEREWGIVVADEVHSVKRWESKRTKNLIDVISHVPKRVGMTGSPLTNDMKDVFATSLFIDGGESFGDHYWKFLNRYFVRRGFGWFPKKTTQKTIERKLSEIAYIVHEDDVLNLPPIRGPIIKVCNLSAEQKRVYTRAATEWEYEIDDEIIEMDYVIAQLQKLRQIASGFVYDPHGNPRWMKSKKLEMVSRMLIDEDALGASPKIVIWAAHSAEVEMVAQIAEGLGRKPVTFCGKDKKAKRAARVAFRDEKKVEVFVGQADSGVGMNELKCADQAAYFSNSTRVVSRQQSMRRIRRTGSEVHDCITYYDLISRGTVDVSIYKALQAKVDLAHHILARARQRQRGEEFLFSF